MRVLIAHEVITFIHCIVKINVPITLPYIFQLVDSNPDKKVHKRFSFCFLVGSVRSVPTNINIDLKIRVVVVTYWFSLIRFITRHVFL